MEEEFKNVKIKAGHIDNEGNLSLEMGEGAGTSIKDFIVPEAFLNRFLTNPACYNTTTQITEEEDIAFCKELYNYIKDSNNAPIRAHFLGIEYYPQVLYYPSENAFWFKIVDTYSIMGKKLMDFTLESNDGEDFYLEIGVFTLTEAQFG